MAGSLNLTTSDRRLLSGVSLFSDLSLEEISELRAKMELRRYRVGEVIYHRRDVATGLFIIAQGAVKTRVVLPDDRTLTFQWFRTGGFFGMNSLLSETDRYTDAVAITACDTLFFPKQDFLSFLDSHPAAMRLVLKVMASIYLVVTEKMHDLAFLDIRGRVAKALLQLSSREAQQPAGAPCVSISQTELASLVGATRESTNKALRFLEQEGWIARERGAVRILEPEYLRQRFQVP